MFTRVLDVGEHERAQLRAVLARGSEHAAVPDEVSARRRDDRVLCAVRPDGRHYLATPHGCGSNALTVHAFPGGEVHARLDPKGILGDDDWFDFQAGYVTNDLVLAGSVEGQRHFALAAATLAVIDEVAHPNNAAKVGISPTGRGTWLTSDYLTGRHQLWQGPWR